MDWLSWSQCSRSCGVGVRKRERKCLIGGQCQDLNSENQQTDECKEQPCLGPEVRWSAWSPWGTCSKTCGNGERNRRRTCSVHQQCKGKWKKIENCTEPPCPETYIGFAVDNSASMAKELEGVKIWIELCMNGTNEMCGDPPTGGWIITAFNNTDVGFVFGPTKNPKHILDVAESYVAKGGGDCPAMTFAGLENVAKVVPSDARACKVFLITDSTPKDIIKTKSVGKQLNDKGCMPIAVLTDCCGTCPPLNGSTMNTTNFLTNLTTHRRKKRSTFDDVMDVKSLLYKFCKKNGGKVFVVDKPSSPEVLVKFFKTKMTLGFCATSDIAGPNAEGYRCKEDCAAMKMCWDKSLRKCYCAGVIPCERRPISQNESRCPEWMSWSSWSTCSRTCGDGRIQRRRKCSIDGKCRNMYPGNEQSQFCNVKSCPAEWREWNTWGSCSKTCGNGKQRRIRYCTVLNKCKGESIQNRKCVEERKCKKKETENATFIGFAVDNSGSMEVEVKSVRLWIETCVNGNKNICGNPPTGGWIITSFNDPDVGDVFGPTKNSQHILDAAGSYVAKDGGDCPEMSLTALESIAKVVPNDARACKVFLFTDSTPKDFVKKKSVAKQFEDKGCKFIPVLTECCDSCPPVDDYVENAKDFRTKPATSIGRKRSTDENVNSLFYKLSKITGGKIFVVDKPNLPETLVKFLMKEVTFGFCATSDIAGPNSEGYQCEEDCAAMKMCWDKSVGKCYCAGTIPCERRPISRSASRCPEWMSWSPWSTCSHTCGDGKIQRRRKCSTEGKCRYMRPGNEQSQSCNVKSCPAEWREWNTWGSCSKTCGEGNQRRIRYCSVLKKCKGESMETRKCVEERKCETWTEWSPWSSCDRLCGDGKRKRERSCSVKGGCRSMKSEKNQVKDCFIRKCLVDCDVKLTSGRCLWFVIRSSKEITYNEAEEICKKKGSTPAVFVDEENYDLAMEVIRARITERAGETFIWTGMTLNNRTTLRTMDHPPHRSWYDNKKWWEFWSSDFRKHRIQLGFYEMGHGMLNWYSTEKEHGVICQTKQP